MIQLHQDLIFSTAVKQDTKTSTDVFKSEYDTRTNDLDQSYIDD